MQNHHSTICFRLDQKYFVDFQQQEELQINTVELLLHQASKLSKFWYDTINIVAWKNITILY